MADPDVSTVDVLPGRYGRTREQWQWQWRRAGALTWLPLLLGALLWAVARIPLDRVTDTGVVTVLPVACWLGLALVLLGTANAIWTAPLREARVVAHVVVLVALLYGGVVASSAYPRGTVPWRHVGIAAQIGATGEVDPGIDAYFNWPGYFALLAAWSGMSGLGDASALMRWAPVGNNLLFLVPMLLIARALVPDRRRAWSGIVLFYLANWVDQDYLAPQALGFFLYLCVVALLLTFFATPDRLSARFGTAVPEDSGGRRVEGPARLLAVVVLVIAAVVAAHQLTPFALLLAVVVLTLLRAVSVRGLGVLTAALIVAWLAYPASTYMSSHLDKLLEQVGDFAGAAQGGIVERAQGSDGHLVVIRARIAFSLLIWGLGAAGAWAMFRRGQLRAAAAALVVAPGLLFALQSYGGEMLLRIFLFSLPFTALLAAQLLPGSESAATRRRAGAFFLVAALLLTPVFVLVRYGNQKIDQRSDAEVAAIRELYAQAPADSLLVAGNDNVPWRNDEYAQHKHRTLGDLGDKNPPLRLDAAVALLHEELLSFERPGLVILTKQQREYERLFGSRLPWTLAHVEQALLLRSDFRVVFRNADAVILRPLVLIGPVPPAFVGPVAPTVARQPAPDVGRRPAPGFVGPVPRFVGPVPPAPRFVGPVRPVLR